MSYRTTPPRTGRRTLTALIAAVLVVLGLPGHASAAEGGTIAGVVMSSTGGPARGAGVVFWKLNSSGTWSPAQSAEADASGAYVSPILAPGRYKVAFGTSWGDYGGEEWYRQAESLEEAQALVVADTDEIHGIDGTAVPRPSISGRISDANGQPIANRWVGVERKTGSNWYRTGQGAATDAQGFYKISPLQPGSYRLFAGGWGPGPEGQYATRWWPDARRSSQAEAIILDESTQSMGKDLQLRFATGSITGQVALAPQSRDYGGGTGIFACPIDLSESACSQSGLQGSAFAQIGSDGQYRIDNLPLDRYVVRFAPNNENYSFEYWSASLRQNATAISVGNGQAVHDVNLSSLSPARVLSGDLIDANGQPANGVSVSAIGQMDSEYGGYSSAQSARGHFSLKIRQAGTYRVQFVDRDLKRFATTWYYANGANETDPASRDFLVDRADVDLGATTLRARPSISGRVTDSAGTPMSGTTITAMSEVDADGVYETETAKTDSNGYYWLPVDTASYQVSFTGPYRSWLTYVPTYWRDALTPDRATRLSVSPGHSAADVNATMQRYTTLAGRVTTSDGTDAAGALVSGFRQDPASGEWVDMGVLVGAGQYGRLESRNQIPPGVWRLRIGGLSGYKDRWIGDAASFEKAQSVTIGEEPFDASIELPRVGAPDTTIGGGPAEGSFATTRSASFGLASSERGSRFDCKLDDAVAQCASVTTLDGLSSGQHTLIASAVASDDIIDPSPASRTWVVPTDDRGFAIGKGWSKKSSAGYFDGTYLSSSTKGATVTLAVSRASRVALYATHAPKNGVVDVYLGSQRLQQVSLAASKTTKSVVTVIKLPTVYSGKLRLVVASSGKSVRLDGVGVRTK